jgi:hypothetical protein
MIEDIYFTRENKNKEASAEEVGKFERSAISDFGRGNRVFIIEKFPKKFYQFAALIKLEKAIEPVSTLSALSNSRLFKVVLANRIY